MFHCSSLTFDQARDNEVVAWQLTQLQFVGLQQTTEISINPELANTQTCKIPGSILIRSFLQRLKTGKLLTPCQQAI